MEIRALTFDVFGTVVDWRGSIIAEGSRLNREKGLNVDWGAFADAWRAYYQPSLSEVRDGLRPWANLDQLHRENLAKLVPTFGLGSLDEGELEHLNRFWHRLHPWPDAVSGIARLKKRYIVAALSNGNVALLVNMARHAGLPWDAILGADISGHYKPQPQAYLTAARLLSLQPGECMMVAAHNSDLDAARQLGFATAFVCRPMEYGRGQTQDLAPTQEWTHVAADLVDLATKLGC